MTLDQVLIQVIGFDIGALMFGVGVFGLLITIRAKSYTVARNAWCRDDRYVPYAMIVIGLMIAAICA